MADAVGVLFVPENEWFGTVLMMIRANCLAELDIEKVAKVRYKADNFRELLTLIHQALTIDSRDQMAVKDHLGGVCKEM
jgi:hypothetical protein